MIRAAALTLALVCAGPVWAQSDDPKGEDAGANTSCRDLGPMIHFCGTPPDFVLTPQSIDSDVTSYFETPEGIQVAAVIEPLEATDALTIEDLRQAALLNLSQASGTPVDQVVVLSQRTALIEGVPHTSFVYRGTVDGEMYVYANSMVLLPGVAAQFVTIEAGVTTYSPRHESVHNRFLQDVQVRP
jgi:hypothetical protein